MTPARTAALGALAALAWPATAAAQPARDAERHEPGAEPPAARAKPSAAPRWLYFRAGGALVAPMTSSRELQLADVNGPASLAVQNGPIAGSGATVDSATIPAIIVGYTLPTRGRRWSLETVLGTPFTVKFEATGTLANMSIAPTALGIPTGIGPLGRELGEAKAVPPILTAVYQLTGDGALRPYLGAGASVLFTYDAHVTNPTLTAVHQPTMTISPAPGLVLQGGLDARLWRSVYARIDVKFIAMKTHAEVHDIEVKTPGLPLFDTVEVGTAKLDLWVNPLIVQAGIGADF
jgi:outer membrane protein W